MSFRLSARSWKNLVGVHPRLVEVVKEAILVTPVDFSVVEGVRSLRKQREYFTRGKSKTMNSRHLTGKAVDLAPWVNGTIDWSDGPHWDALSTAMKASAEKLGVVIEWGGEIWPTFRDAPHFQLSRSVYPD